ncbi:formate dehydrogenase accessory sulfurtransferase FdhD [soil metagenome]
MPRTERFIVTRVGADGSSRRPDELIVEEPLTIQLDGVTVSTTMRTPGNDYELAVGFCFTEGLLAGARVTGVRYCAAGPAVETEFNAVSVDTGGLAPPPMPRLGLTSSSCGWCGSDQLDELAARLDPLPDIEPIPLDVLRAVPDDVRETQVLFESTGSVHAAAVFDAAGNVSTTREDVGRHNAVDKVIGARQLSAQDAGQDARDGPASGLGLFVSGRASIEMVQKAWAGGFTTVLAVSAPTSLAVRAARRAGIMLVGFVRDDSLNVYSQPPRRRTPVA